MTSDVPQQSDDVAERLAWLASAGTEEEALLIESALLTQTAKGPHGDDHQEDE
jgi:hypothetical protein